MTERIPPQCSDVMDSLSDLLDGDLSPTREIEMRSHLAGCLECSACLADLRRIRENLAELPPADPLPAGLEDRVHRLARLAGLLRPPRRRTWLPWAAAAALVVLAVAVGYRGFLPEPSPDARWTSVLQELEEAERLYRDASARLEQLARHRLDTLPPELAEAFAVNLELVNQAVEDSHHRLTTHRHNPAAWEYALAAYQQKVEFLLLLLDTEDMRTGRLLARSPVSA